MKLYVVFSKKGAQGNCLTHLTYYLPLLLLVIKHEFLSMTQRLNLRVPIGKVLNHYGLKKQGSQSPKSSSC